MAARTPRPPQNWLPYVGLMMSVAGIIYQGGVVTNRVDALDTRVTKIEDADAATDAADAARAETLRKMDERGVRNEEKLNYLVEQARGNRP